MGALSRKEEKLVEMTRHIRPEDRAHLRAIVDALVSAAEKTDETGSD